MKKKIMYVKRKIALPFLLLSLIITITSAPTAEEVIRDENLFLQKFTEALKADDHGRMKELVKKAEFIVYKTVISRAEKGIRSVVEGKDSSEYFNLAESIAAIYTMEFKKEGFLNSLGSTEFTIKKCAKKKLKGML